MRGKSRLRAVLSLVVVFALVLGACGDDDGGPDPDKTTIKIGFFPGPYADMFDQGVLPILEGQGYTYEVTEFSNALAPNDAVQAGEIDVNIFQNDAFQDSYNEQNDTQLVRLMYIPSAPLGIYSDKHASLDDIQPGMSISLPNEPNNIPRAMMFLSDLGLVTINEGVDPEVAMDTDVTSDYELVLIDAPQIIRSMGDVDYGVSFGNHVIAAGRKLSEAFALEDPAKKYQIIITVREDNLDAQWAKDLEAAWQSEEFRQFMETDPDFIGFSTPDYWR